MINENKMAIAKLLNVENETAESLYDKLMVPADEKNGDYSLPCFPYARTMRKAPAIIAQEIAASITVTPPIANVEAVNGYVNFTLDKLYAAEKVVNTILAQGHRYGSSIDNEGKTVCIDYSSINIAKPFHIGHLLTTVIGGALYRIYKKLGYTAVGINHLGDWGTQFGKLIVAYKKWGDAKTLELRGMPYLTELYVRFHSEAETQPELNDEARFYFKKIEDGDAEALGLFDTFKQITLREVQKTYKRLKIHFDSYHGEAFYNDKMQPVLDEIERKGLLTESDGAKIVDLSAYDMPPCLLVKADGATLYATRDLAAAYYRKKRYDFDRCLYVVAYQQNLHFRQWFKVIELLGHDWNLEHVAFGMVSLEDGAMSTRKGKVVLLEDVLNKAVEKSLAVITEKSPNLENKEDIAEKVGVGAVIFSALYNNRIKDMVFDYNKVLNFDGETAPYIQYTNARCNSILKKAGRKKFAETDYAGINNPEAAALITALEKFPETLEETVRKNEPCYVARLLVTICRGFNKFYYEHRILNAPEQYVSARIKLVKATHIVLAEGLRLLGISAPKQM